MPIQRKVQPNSLSEKKRSNKKSIVLNIIALLILIILCFAAGIVLGLLTTLYIPEIQISNNEENKFKILSRNNKIVIGGKLKILLKIKNEAILSSNLNLENIQYFYYPVGKNYSCLLYNGGVLGNNETDTLALQYRSEIGTPVNNSEDFIVTKFSVHLKYTLYGEDDMQIFLPFSLGYEVTEQLKEEIQPLYNDCKNFKKIFFSIRFNTVQISNAFKTTTHNNFFEYVFYSKCVIDEKVDAFFNAQPKNKKIILQGMTNNPSLIE